LGAPIGVARGADVSRMCPARGSRYWNGAGSRGRTNCWSSGIAASRDRDVESDENESRRSSQDNLFHSSGTKKAHRAYATLRRPVKGSGKCTLIRGAQTWERRLETWASSHAGGDLSPVARKRVQDRLASSLNPVSPLPSQGRLALVFFAVFDGCSLALIAMSTTAEFKRLGRARALQRAGHVPCGRAD
jgi:hypothetical protein